MKHLLILFVLTSFVSVFAGSHVAYAAPAASAQGHVGIVKYYSKNLMERVRLVRLRQGYKILPVEGMALTGPGSCGHVGELYDLRIGNGPWELRQVVDCSQPWDAYRHAREGLVGEVSYVTMSRHRGLFRSGHAAASVRPHRW